MTHRGWLLATLTLAASACGWYPFPYGTGEFHAASGCLEVRSDFAVSQEALDHDVRAAVEVLDRRGVVSADRFCEEFSGVPVAVSAGTSVGGHKNGEFSVLRGVLLDRTGVALVHELIHEVDVTRDMNVCSASHCGWEEDGYYLADSDYALQALDLQTGLQSVGLDP